MKFPKRKYDIIYADPPWEYPGGHKHWSGAARNHYSTLSLEEIKRLPVPRIANDNCLLFLWTTGTFLPYAFDVLGSWGFEYVQVAFVWVKILKRKSDVVSHKIKTIINPGRYVRQNAEFVLLGRQGKTLNFVKSHNIKQIVFAERRGHSYKPNEVAKRIDKLCQKNATKIELFARERMKGWDA